MSLGLRDAGYEYINTDDTWSASARAANGTLVADSTKWPNGIAVVAAELHSMGLKMGECFQRPRDKPPKAKYRTLWRLGDSHMLRISRFSRL